MKKYTIILLTIVFFVVLGLSGFAADKPKIGLSFSDFTLERWVREAEEMTKQRAVLVLRLLSKKLIMIRRFRMTRLRIWFFKG